MLTAKMEIDEVMREVMQDVRWLHGWQEMNEKVLSKELLMQLKNGQRTCSVVRTLRSPHTRNEWTMMMSIRAPKIIPIIFQWTTLQDEDGVYVYQPVLGDDTWRLIILSPHVFRRYRERMHLGDNLTMAQLIRRYMKMNVNGTFMPNSKHNGEPAWALCMEEGLVLGRYVSELCFFGSTFITHDILHDGRQSRMAWEGEEKRQAQRPKVAGIKATIRMARDAERITNECERDYREQTGHNRNKESMDNKKK